jgi:hypothetical protein
MPSLQKGTEMKQITWDEFEEIETEWEAVTETNIVDQRRWVTVFEQVFKGPDGRFFKLVWEQGSTEYQESDTEPYMIEVEPYEVTVTKYKVKK